MMGRTHMAFGFLAGILLAPIFKADWLIFVPLATIAALLPDVDHENSKINRMLPLTRWVPKLFKHRGFFHSIFPVILIYFGFHYLELDYIGLPIAIGYLAHLGSDCLTKMGCNLLHPITNFRIRGFIQTDGAMELVTMGAVMCLNIIFTIQYFF